MSNAKRMNLSTPIRLRRSKVCFSNELDPRHATALVQLVNCSQRINQHAELEARLETLEQAGNGTAASISEKDSEPAGASANELPRAGKPRTPSHPAACAKKAASQA